MLVTSNGSVFNRVNINEFDVPETAPVHEVNTCSSGTVSRERLWIAVVLSVMCWNRIIHMLVRSTWSVLQRDTGADPNWDAASAAIRGRRAGLKHRSTLTQSIFPSLTLYVLSPSPSGSCAFLAAAARCVYMLVSGDICVCVCWNPPRRSLCVCECDLYECPAITKLALRCLFIHTHIFLLDVIKTPSAVSAHTYTN